MMFVAGSPLWPGAAYKVFWEISNSHHIFPLIRFLTIESFPNIRLAGLKRPAYSLSPLRRGPDSARGGVAQFGNNNQKSTLV